LTVKNRHIMAETAVAGAVGFAALFIGAGVASADTPAPEQAAPDTACTADQGCDDQAQHENQSAQAAPAPGNGLPCPLCELSLPPMPDIPPPNIPPPFQVTVPISVGLPGIGLPGIGFSLAPPSIPGPQAPSIPAPSIPAPAIPLPPPPF
jgi:hypothetical protein